MKKLLGIVIIAFMYCTNIYAINLTECYISAYTKDGVTDFDDVTDKFDTDKFETNSSLHLQYSYERIT